MSIARAKRNPGHVRVAPDHDGANRGDCCTKGRDQEVARRIVEAAACHDHVVRARKVLLELG